MKSLVNSTVVESKWESKRFVCATTPYYTTSIHFVFTLGEHTKKIDMTMAEVIVILCRMEM